MDYGEADRVVHLLTQVGRLSAFAHGARKSKRRLAGALEPFSTVELSVTPSRKRDAMVTIGSSQVVNARLGIREDLGRIAVAARVVELGEASSPEGDASAETFALVSAALDLLEGAPASRALRCAFEVLLVDVLGLRPVLDACATCGAPIARDAIAGFDLARGGALCPAHAEGARSIGSRTRAWIEHVLAAGALGRSGAEVDPDWAHRAAAKASPLFADFFSGLFGRSLRSSRMISDLDL